VKVFYVILRTAIGWQTFGGQTLGRQAFVQPTFSRQTSGLTQPYHFFVIDQISVGKMVFDQKMWSQDVKRNFKMEFNEAKFGIVLGSLDSHQKIFPKKKIL
jgi:hypothetical protein